MKNKTEKSLPIHPILPKAALISTVFILFGLLVGILGNSDAFAKSSKTAQTGQVSSKTAAQNSEFAQLKKIIKDYIKQKYHLTEGDLIVRKEAKAVIEALQKKGYGVHDPKTILKKMLTKGSFLAKTLRNSPQGRKFMQQISRYPLAYDQLDRLATQPVGRRTVTDLVRGPDGYKMLQYMNKKPYGTNLGKMLSKGPRGGNYNKPTGRIYTVKQLTEAIWKQKTSSK